MASALDLFDLEHGREELADLVGQVGVAVDVLLQRRPFALPIPSRKLLRQLIEQGELTGTLAGHVTTPAHAEDSPPSHRENTDRWRANRLTLSDEQTRRPRR